MRTGPDQLLNSHRPAPPTHPRPVSGVTPVARPLASRLTLSSILFLIALCGLAPACGKRADLIARNGMPDVTTSCQLDDQGQLVITILNQGKKEAKATTTEIAFGTLPPIRLPTRPIPPGESASVTFPVPDDCFRPECQFQITVDAKNEVEESEERNNQVIGRCAAAPP